MVQILFLFSFLFTCGLCAIRIFNFFFDNQPAFAIASGATPEQGLFESTVDIRGQLVIEDLLRRLPDALPESGPAGVVREQRFQFGPNLRRGLPLVKHTFAVLRRDVGQFIEQTS